MGHKKIIPTAYRYEARTVYFTQPIAPRSRFIVYGLTSRTTIISCFIDALVIVVAVCLLPPSSHVMSLFVNS